MLIGRLALSVTMSKELDHSAVFTEAMARHIEGNQEILEHLAELRRIGEAGNQVAEAALKCRFLNTLRMYWIMWALELEEDGHDPETMLAKHCSDELIRSVMLAFWGDDRNTRPGLRLVPSD